MTEHKKPTTPAVQVRIYTDGRAERQTLTLSSQKTVQEGQAVVEFGRLLNVARGRKAVSEIKSLDENDHDFVATVDGRPVVIQLTELVGRLWLRDAPVVSEDKFGVMELSLGGGANHFVDVKAQDDALRWLIAKKLEKQYTKPVSQDFWLVIFTTANYWPELGEGDTAVISKGLKTARDYLFGLATNPFDQIWFTNLRRAPTLVWPRLGQDPPVRE